MSQKIPSQRTLRRAQAHKELKAARKAEIQNGIVYEASPAQVQANRQNATHSTGPTSAEGKAAISQNRRTHGLNCKPETFTVLACENQADYDELLNTFLEEQEPQDTLEHLLVTAMVQHRWLLRRANRLQETCFDQATGQIANEKTFALYLRYATTHERAFHKCLADLLKLRKEKFNEQIGFERECRAVEKHELDKERSKLNIIHRQWEVSALQVKVFRLERLNPEVPNVAQTV